MTSAYISDSHMHISNQRFKYLFDSLLVWFIDFLLVWFIDFLLVWFVDSLLVWFVDSILVWFVDFLLVWFVDFERQFFFCFLLDRDSQHHTMFASGDSRSLWNIKVNGFCSKQQCLGIITLHYIKKKKIICSSFGSQEGNISL